MADSGGAEQDARGEAHWRERVLVRHRFKRFSPPSVVCRCDWSATAPRGLGVIAQRDYLLDLFNDHRKFMFAERRRITGKRAN